VAPQIRMIPVKMVPFSVHKINKSYWSSYVHISDHCFNSYVFRAIIYLALKWLIHVIQIPSYTPMN